MPATYLPRLLWRRVRERGPPPAVAGGRDRRLDRDARGGLACGGAGDPAATIDSGAPFADRDLIVFLTYAVILCTLVLQGLTLPGLIAALDLGGEAPVEQREATARLLAAQRGDRSHQPARP